MLTPTLDAAAPTPLAQATPAVAQVTSQPSPVLVTPTAMPLAVVQSPAASVTPVSTPTLLPPISPMSIFTPARCLILIIVGLVVFTVTYGVQMALWWRRRK